MTYRLFLDDYREPPKDGGQWTVARSMKEAVDLVLDRGIPSYISFDHDLADEHYAVYEPEELKTRFDDTGYDFAKWFGNYVLDNNVVLPDNFGYYVHSMNPAGAVNIRTYMENFLKHYKARE